MMVIHAEGSLDTYGMEEVNGMTTITGRFEKPYLSQVDEQVSRCRLTLGLFFSIFFLRFLACSAMDSYTHLFDMMKRYVE